MCGDLDGDTQADEQILDQFMALAAQLGCALRTSPPEGALDIGSSHLRAHYMQTLFESGLRRATEDCAAAESGLHADAIAAQAVVFARLSGLLTSLLPPDSDLFRQCIEAMADGHGELGRRVAAQKGHHHHHHDHAHNGAHAHEH